MIGNIRDTTSSHERSTVLEVMEETVGKSHYMQGLQEAEAILIPEEPFDINAICERLIIGKNRGKPHSLIIKAEGVDLPSDELARIITERAGMETKVVVLGYVQRGGTPSARDRMLASRMGKEAVELLIAGISSRAVGIRGNKIIHDDLGDVIQIPHQANESLIELANILSI